MRWSVSLAAVRVCLYASVKVFMCVLKAIVLPCKQVWAFFFQVRTVKIDALDGNYCTQRELLLNPFHCYSLTAGGFLHKLLDDLFTVSQHVCVPVFLNALQLAHKPHTDTVSTLKCPNTSMKK